MVKEEANYWAKKAVSFKHLHAKKRKTAQMVLWVFIMLVYRKKEKKKIHLFRGNRVCDHQGHQFIPQHSSDT